MTKKIILILCSIFLLIAFVACEIEEAKTNDEKQEKTEVQLKDSEIISELAETKEPIATPAPEPVVIDVAATNSSFFKINDNGTTEKYLGYGFERNSYEKEHDLNEQLVDRDIPVVIDFSEYKYDPWFPYDVVDITTIDNEKYKEKYGNQIDSIKSSMYLEYEKKNKEIIKTVSNTNGTITIYNSNELSGLVYADIEFEYYYDDGSDYWNWDEYKVLSFSIFEGEQIIDVAIGDYYILGLKDDGTIIPYYPEVLTYKLENKILKNEKKYKFKDYSKWFDIIDVEIFNGYDIGLKSDGNICVLINEEDEENEEEKNEGNIADFFSNWDDIIQIEVLDEILVGLKSDGSIIMSEQNLKYDLNNWKDIIEIKTCNTSIYDNSIYGLAKDGRIFSYTYEKSFLGESEHIINGVLNWTNIISFDANNQGVIGLSGNGEIKHISNDNLIFCIDEYCNGISDVIVDNESYYYIKKDDAVIKIGDYNWTSPNSDLEVLWSDIQKNNNIEKDFSKGDYIDPDKRYFITISQENELLTESWSGKYSYSIEANIIEIVSFNEYAIILSEYGDLIILSLTLFTDSEFNGIIIEQAINMSNFKKMVSNHKSIGFLYNDGSFDTLDIFNAYGLGGIDVEWINYDGYCLINEYYSSNISNIYTNRDSFLTWDEFNDMLGFELPKLNGKSHYSVLYPEDHWCYYEVECNEEAAYAYVELLENSDNIIMEYEYDTIGTIQYPDGSETTYDIKAYEFKGNSRYFTVKISYEEEGIRLKISFESD